jgi:hypothetical protein
MSATTMAGLAVKMRLLADYMDREIWSAGIANAVLFDIENMAEDKS